MHVTPYGAADTVTGSCHLVEHHDARVLLDCGMYQGPEEDRNADSFGFPPGALDAVVLSHAHLDHVGRLPRLLREARQVPVYATPATCRLLPIMLEDALHVMIHDRERARRRGDPLPQPLWTERDLARVLDRLRPLPYGEPCRVGDLSVSLHDAGHLPGSAFIQVDAPDARLVFSGDIGHPGKDVMPAPDALPPCDLALCESTYGDRPHRAFAATLAQFREVLCEVLGAGGQVVIPSFALERTQEVLFHLNHLQRSGAVPVVPVFLDSPLAIRVTEAFGGLGDSFGPRVRAMLDAGDDPFHPPDFRPTSSVDASKSINLHHGPAVVIAGSGMFHGGRILHHLRRILPHAEHCLMIIGYQPRGGLGRRLIDGDYPVRIHGQRVPVYARIETVNGFSAHAGQDDLVRWLEPASRVALVHGEPASIDALAAALRARGQSVDEARWGEPLAV